MPRIVGRTGIGCLVSGTIFGGRAGQQVTVTLERPCTWNGHLVPMRFEVTTDDRGRFEMWLPPTSQMTARDGGSTPLYLFVAEQVGSWQFAVPVADAWSLAG